MQRSIRVQRTCRECGVEFEVLPGVVNQHGGIYCDMKCRRAAQQHRWSSDERLSRFWSMVEKTECCWLWDGYLTRSGYGYFAFDRKSEPTHRISYRLAYGEVPDGLIVRHQCDVKECVRPDHLVVGTQLENIADYLERHARPKCCGWLEAGT